MAPGPPLKHPFLYRRRCSAHLVTHRAKAQLGTVSFQSFACSLPVLETDPKARFFSAKCNVIRHSPVSGYNDLSCSVWIFVSRNISPLPVGHCYSSYSPSHLPSLQSVNYMLTRRACLLPLIQSILSICSVPTILIPDSLCGESHVGKFNSRRSRLSL